MPKLPKSVVLDGRRYPTWALSAQARAHLVSIHEADAHIEALQVRLDYQYRVQMLLHEQLRQALKGVALERTAPRYFWHIVPEKWFRANWPVAEGCTGLEPLGASGLYQQQDRLVLYARGKGVIGWGEIMGQALQPELEWRCLAHTPAAIMPAKTVRYFALRHPTRVSQRIADEADIDGLLNALASNVAMA